MSTNEGKKNEEKEKKEFHLPKKLLIGIISLAVIAVVVIGIGKTFRTDGKTTRLGFEDVGELVTQVAYTTNVKVIDDSRTFYKWDIPFTKSHYVFSYDCELRAGIDFEKIKWKVDEEEKEISVKLPDAKIMGNEIKNESLKIYVENESIYNEVKLEEINQAQEELKSEAEADAIANGFLENAQNNAKMVLRGFFGNVYDLNKYEIKYVKEWTDVEIGGEDIG